MAHRSPRHSKSQLTSSVGMSKSVAISYVLYSGFPLWMAPVAKAEPVTLMFLFNDTVCGDGKRGTEHNEKKMTS